METVTIRSHLRMVEWKENFNSQIESDSRENANNVRPRDCYIGHWESDKDFVCCFHKEYESKSLSIGTYFHGHVETTDEGCKVTGYYSKKKSVNIFFIFGGIITVFATLSSIVLKDYQTALVAGALFAIIAINYFGTPKRQKDRILKKLEEISFTDNYTISKGKATKYRKNK